MDMDVDLHTMVLVDTIIHIVMDTEADPWLHYGYGRGLAYYGLGGYYHPYSYGYWGRKKREAEAAAEPEAAADPEADPWYRYGYLYGHRAYYGYPYAGYYWGK